MMFVGLDPGGSTGVATWSGMYTDVVERFEFDRPNHHRELYNWLHRQNPTVLIVEDFKWTTTPASLISKEYIGVCQLYSQFTGTRMELQDRSMKQFWSDDKIKAIGLWLPGKPHAIDALRHLLYYVTVRQNSRAFVTALREATQ